MNTNIDELKYTTKSRELGYKGRLLEVYTDTVELPDGREVSYDVIDHKGAAAIIPVLDNGDILLVRQFRHAINSFTWEIPAGGRDSREEPFIETAKRELKEETGRTAEKFTFLVSINPVAAYSSEQIDIYVAEGLSAQGEQDLDDDEFIGVRAFSPEEIEKMIFDQEIRDAKTIASVFAYLQKNRVSAGEKNQMSAEK